MASAQGLDGVTFGQVADAAGVSKGHLAQLFGDREALQLAVLDGAVEVFTDRVIRHADEAPTGIERLRRYCLGWFDYVEGRVLPGGCLITAASSEFRTINGAVRDRLVEFRRRRCERLRTMIAAVLAERNEPRRDDVDDLVYQILAYEAAANVAYFLEDKAAFAHARHKTAALLDGLGS